MTSQIGQQIITKHLLPNISGSKGYQAIEFVQLMKYSVRNIFVQKPIRKSGRETSSRLPFCFRKKLYIK